MKHQVSFFLVLIFLAFSFFSPSGTIQDYLSFFVAIGIAAVIVLSEYQKES